MLEVEAEAETADGFEEAEIGIIRDNAKQLKSKAESTGFADLCHLRLGPKSDVHNDKNEREFGSVLPGA